MGDVDGVFRIFSPKKVSGAQIDENTFSSGERVCFAHLIRFARFYDSLESLIIWLRQSVMQVLIFPAISFF